MKIHHRDGTTTSYGHSGSAGLKAFKSGSSSSSSSSSTKTTPKEEPVEDWRVQAKFNANVNSLMRAGFSTVEAKQLATKYGNQNVSISKTYSWQDKSNLKKAIVATTPSVTTSKLNKMELSINNLAKEYAAKGVSKERFFQKVARDARTEDSKVQNYLLRYSKTAAGIFGEAREHAARIADVADTFSMLPTGVRYAIENPSTIPSSLKVGFTGSIKSTSEDFSKNPSRAAVGLITSIILFSGVTRGMGRAQAKVASPKTVVNRISKVKTTSGKWTSSKLHTPVANKIRVIERNTARELASLSNQYKNVVQSYNRIPKSRRSGKATVEHRRQLTAIERKMKKAVSDKNHSQMEIMRLSRKYRKKRHSTETLKAMLADLKGAKTKIRRSKPAKNIRAAKKKGKKKAKEVKTKVKRSDAAKKARAAKKKGKAKVKAVNTSVKQSKPAKKARATKKKVGEKTTSAKKSLRRSKPAKKVRATKKGVKSKVAKSKKAVKQAKTTTKATIKKQYTSLRTKISNALRRKSAKGVSKKKLEALQQELKIANQKYIQKSITAMQMRQKIRKISADFAKYEEAEKAMTYEPVNIKIVKTPKKGKIRDMGAEFRKASKESVKKGTVVKSGNQQLIVKQVAKQATSQKTVAKQVQKQAQKQVVKSKQVVSQAQRGKTKIKTKAAQKARVAVIQKQIKAVSATQAKLITQKQKMQALTKRIQATRVTTKTAQTYKASQLKSLRTAIKQITEQIQAQKQAARSLAAAQKAIMKLPVPIPLKKTATKKKPVASRKATRTYSPRQMTDKVATFKQMFG